MTDHPEDFAPHPARTEADIQAKRQFIREVLSRTSTPEVEARLAEAAQFAKSALEAPFLAKFRKPKQ